MVVAGGGLVVIAGVLIIAALASNTSSVHVHLFGIDISGISVGAVFIGGMITTIVAVVGIVLLVAGLRRDRRKRAQRKTLEREHRRLTEQSAGAAPEQQLPDQGYRTDADKDLPGGR